MVRLYKLHKFINADLLPLTSVLLAKILVTNVLIIIFIIKYPHFNLYLFIKIFARIYYIFSKNSYIINIFSIFSMFFTF